MIQNLSNLNISPEELEELLSLGKLKKHPSNTLLLEEGRVCNSWFYIQKGITRHFIDTDKGKSLTKNFTTKGNFVFSSISSFVSKKGSLIQFETLTPCEIIEWDKDVFERFFKKDKWKNLYYHILENFILKKEEKELSLLKESAEERYLNFFQKRAYLFNEIPHYHIASFLFMSPETLSRIRKKQLK